MYNSTDFWYTFINSLYNEGLSYGRGELEMDEETQAQFLAYIKEKMGEDVVDGVTTLAPGFQDYFWRFPKEMLSKLRALAGDCLATDPENAAATIILTIVADAENNSDHWSYINTMMKLVPKDPCANIIFIHKYHRNSGSIRQGDDYQEQFLTILENLFEWAKQEGATDRYQDAKSTYNRIGRSPGSVYKKAKKKLQELKDDPEKPEDQNERRYLIEMCNALINRCRTAFYNELAAFQKEGLQETDEQQDFGDPTSEKVDFWETYLNSLDDRELSSSKWKPTLKVQEQLLTYFKTRIEVGVVDGQTKLPADLSEYIQRFPKGMRFELRELADEVLEMQPNNGAAAKLLAFIVEDKEYPFLEQAIDLLPNDAEICFYAISRDDNPFSQNENTLFDLVLPTLEKLFERAQRQEGYGLYHWLTRVYSEYGKTPCHIYRKLMRNPEGNTELLARSKTLIHQAKNIFEQRLEEEPDDWYSLRGLGDIYETLGETELASKYPWEPHPEYRWAEIAWEGLKLPDFSATTYDGKPISYSDYKGKLVLLNFCAKWCGFCAPEIPYIKEVYQEYHDNGFDVIGVSLDDSEAELREYIDEHEIPWKYIFDGKGWDSEIARFIGIRGVPSQWLIDRDGTIISVENRQFLLGQNVYRTEATRIGEVISDFTAIDIDGNPISPATFQGKVTLLYLGFPNQVLDDLEAVYQKYHQNGFEVIGVSVMMYSNEDQLRDYVRKEKVIGRHIYDGGHWDGPLARQFGIGAGRTYPAIVLIDKEGKVIMSRNKEVYSPEEWNAKLEELVAIHLGL